MFRKKLGLLTLLAVLGLMVFGGATAHSEAGANWLILTSGGVLKTGAELHATLASELKTSVALQTKILGIKMELVCTGFSLIGMGLEGSGSLTNGGKGRAKGCTVFLNGVLTNSCEPHSAGLKVGEIETLALKGSLLLVPVENERVLVEPKEGENLAIIVMSETCLVGEKIPVRGKLYLFDIENKFKTHLVKHEVEESAFSELWVLNKTVEHTVEIERSAKIFLAPGEHSGLAWGGDAG